MPKASDPLKVVPVASDPFKTVEKTPVVQSIKPDSTQKDNNSKNAPIKVYSVTLQKSLKDGKTEDPDIMMSTPVFYCFKCDNRFPALTRLLEHERVCIPTKDPLGGVFDIEEKYRKIYICQFCNCTSFHALSVHTHLRRCKKVHKGVRKTSECIYLCNACRITKEPTLTGLISHSKSSCPAVYSTRIKLETDAVDEVVVIDDDDD